MQWDFHLTSQKRWTEKSLFNRPPPNLWQPHKLLAGRELFKLTIPPDRPYLKRQNLWSLLSSARDRIRADPLTLRSDHPKWHKFWPCRKSRERKVPGEHSLTVDLFWNTRNEIQLSAWIPKYLLIRGGVEQVSVSDSSYLFTISLSASLFCRSICTPAHRRLVSPLEHRHFHCQWVNPR